MLNPTSPKGSPQLFGLRCASQEFCLSAICEHTSVESYDLHGPVAQHWHTVVSLAKPMMHSCGSANMHSVWRKAFVITAFYVSFLAFCVEDVTCPPESESESDYCDLYCQYVTIYMYVQYELTCVFSGCFFLHCHKKSSNSDIFSFDNNLTTMWWAILEGLSVR